VVGLAKAEVREEQLVEFIVVVLSGMNEDVLADLIDPRNHTRKSYNLRSSPNDGDHL
jgi:hypothetical protein